MPAHIVFLTLALSFISGVVYASVGASFLLSITAAVLAGSLLRVYGAPWKVALISAACIVAGSGYYLWDDARYRARVEMVPVFVEVRGMVSDDPIRKEGQTFYVNTEYGKFLVRTSAEPVTHYGDVVLLAGKTELPPENSYGSYLAKERVVAVMQNPHLKHLASRQGNIVFTLLYDIKADTVATFERYLSPEQAAFVSGITLGINADFSDSFLEALSLSGTRHLTAISGQNFSIMIFIVAGILTVFLARRYALLATYILMLLFVALIGFQVSAVRALVMAGIVQVAQETRRAQAPHNALALSALLFAILNPKVIVFDVGFQLSFLAVFAIIYLVPIFDLHARQSEGGGVFGLREAFLTTVCAQVMTAPVLIAQFHNFSLTAVIANMLVLGIIPVIMILGFFLALIALIVPWFAYLASLLLSPLVEYAFVVIRAGAHFSYVFDPPLGFLGIAAYYGAVAALLYWHYEWREPKRMREDAGQNTQAHPPEPVRTGFHIIDETH